MRGIARWRAGAAGLALAGALAAAPGCRDTSGPERVAPGGGGAAMDRPEHERRAGRPDQEEPLPTTGSGEGRGQQRDESREQPVAP